MTERAAVVLTLQIIAVMVALAWIVDRRSIKPTRLFEGNAE